MEAILTYKGLLWHIGIKCYQTRRQTGRTNRMVGLLFTRPGSQLGDELEKSRGYWHYRSGEFIDFYWAGYRNDDWKFDPKVFDEFRHEFQRHTKWKYSGGSDLILFDARLKPGEFDDCRAEESVSPDFTSAVVCHLDAMKRIDAFTSCEEFFERVFTYVEQHPDDSSVRGFSDEMFVSHGGSIIQRLVLSLLPKDLGKSVEQLRHYAVVGIGKG